MVKGFYKIDIPLTYGIDATEKITEADVAFDVVSGHSHTGADSKLIGGGQAFPIGSVFIAVVATNPNTLLGYGTWSAFGAGRVLVGLDGADPDFDVVEETGGAKTVASSAQTFGGTPSSAIVNHVHVQSLPSGQTGSQASGTRDTSTTGSTADALSTANPTGGVASYTPSGINTPGAATSVVQPYIVVYMWKRTA